MKKFLKISLLAIVFSCITACCGNNFGCCPDTVTTFSTVSCCGNNGW